MKKNTLTLSICAAMLFSCTLAIAESDYPAADFQPKVIFQDGADTSSQSSVTPEAKSTTASDSNYPAADFQPKVVYQNDSAQAAPEASTTKEQSVATDSAHPAADFQPKVLFTDPDYKPAPAAAQHTNAAATETKLKAATSSTSAENAPAAQAESDGFSLIGIGLLALIAIGFTRFKGICKLRAVNSSTRNHDGLTGVAKYLAAHDKSSISGVAKYLAKKAEAENKPTSVDTYLRNRR